PQGQQLTIPQSPPPRSPGSGQTLDSPPAPPSIDEVADAVLRATTRYATAASGSKTLPSAAAPGELSSPSPAVASATSGPSTVKQRPAATGPIVSTGPLHRILE